MIGGINILSAEFPARLAEDVFSEWDLAVGVYELRRQAERDAALEQASRLGCPPKSAVAAALCQRSPKAVVISCSSFSEHLILKHALVIFSCQAVCQWFHPSNSSHQFLRPAL